MYTEVGGTTPMDCRQARSLFPAAGVHAYLNCAAQGPPPTPVAEAMVRYIDDLHLNGCINWPRWEGVMGRCRQRFAALVGGSVEGVALVKNTTQGLLIAAEALPLGRGDTVVVNDMEFPANLHPWHHVARRRGARVKVLASRAGRLSVDQVREALNRQVRILAISAVQYENGFHADMEAIGELCHERGVVLVVDAIQACGVTPVDVARWRVGMLACGGHKWLLSAGGAGFLYVDPGLLDRLEPANPGWLGVAEPMTFPTVFTPAPGARRFEEGNPNLAGIVGLDASLELLAEVGVPAIREHVLALNDHLVEGLERKGYRVESPQAPGERSAITLFRGGPLSARMLHGRLSEAGVVVAARGGGIRVAPHLFNDESDVDRLLDALP